MKGGFLYSRLGPSSSLPAVVGNDSLEPCTT